jgi:hypothetical protein
VTGTVISGSSADMNTTVYDLVVARLINTRGSDWLPNLSVSPITPTIYYHLLDHWLGTLCNHSLFSLITSTSNLTTGALQISHFLALGLVTDWLTDWLTDFWKQSRVALRLTVSQSICLGVEPTLCLWPDIISRLTVSVGKFISCLCLAPSLTRGGSVICPSLSVVICLYEH